ncbi:sensor histidine kinase, partial [Salmonella enterica]|uniref:sensor histidine kinase n=1 Tax=Salmonella enterica TaxID=28901 RepID=UPI003CF85477
KSGLALSFIPCRHFVRSDRGLVLSVIQNFVSNAIRYTPSGRILIGCRRRGEEIELIVADTGPGIAPEQQEMVFEEFK